MAACSCCLATLTTPPSCATYKRVLKAYMRYMANMSPPDDPVLTVCLTRDTNFATLISRGSDHIPEILGSTANAASLPRHNLRNGVAHRVARATRIIIDNRFAPGEAKRRGSSDEDEAG